MEQIQTIIYDMSNEILIGIQKCRVMQKYLPAHMMLSIGEIVDESNKTFLLETEFQDKVAIAGKSSTTTSLFSLPFDDTRDSRQNYRRQEQMRIFKNREGIRDNFLYQLREFQNVSSKKLLNSEELSRYSSGMKLAANGLLKKIYIPAT